MWLFFKSNHWGIHIPSSWMVHAGCVFVAGIHPSRTWMSGSFESVWWNACVHRQDLGLYSHPKSFFGNGVRTHGKLPGKPPPLPEAQRRIEPTMLHYAGQQAQHTTDWAIPAPTCLQYWVLFHCLRLGCCSEPCNESIMCSSMQTCPSDQASPPSHLFDQYGMSDSTLNGRGLSHTHRTKRTHTHTHTHARTHTHKYTHTHTHTHTHARAHAYMHTYTRASARPQKQTETLNWPCSSQPRSRRTDTERGDRWLLCLSQKSLNRSSVFAAQTSCRHRLWALVNQGSSYVPPLMF